MMLHHVLYLAFTACLSFNSVQSFATASTHYTLFEQIQGLPAGWMRLDEPVPASNHIKLNIHLTQQNEDLFEQALFRVSSPADPDYGRHLSQLELDKLLAPHEQSVLQVKTWLQTFNFTENAEFRRDDLVLDLTIEQAETLLHTKYAYYSDSVSLKTVVRTESYSLPAYLHPHIAFVQPTTMFGLLRPQSSNAILAAEATSTKTPAVVSSLEVSCNKSITPSCLSYLYGFDGYKATDNSEIGIAGFLFQSAQKKDVKQFLTTYAPQYKSNSFAAVSINSGTLQQGLKAGDTIRDIMEAGLDVEYTTSISSPIKNTFYSTGDAADTADDASSEPYIAFLTYLLSLKVLPQTFTISYGDLEDSIPKAYATKVCNMFGQLGARGVSVLVSSGDSGPGASCSSLTAKFNAIFPASCPYVTAVGATTYIKPEQASGISGGGFSTYFAMPAYQEVDVTRFFRRHPSTWRPFSQNINRGGRAFPDVSAQGERFATILNGTLYYLSGTSAAAPTFAGIVALLNSERIKRGEKALGFLNPWLYSTAVAQAKGLTDITHGTSIGCLGFDAEDHVVNGGWQAVSGFDLSTGLGTPNFKGLLKALCT